MSKPLLYVGMNIQMKYTKQKLNIFLILVGFSLFCQWKKKKNIFATFDFSVSKFLVHLSFFFDHFCGYIILVFHVFFRLLICHSKGNELFKTVFRYMCNKL